LWGSDVVLLQPPEEELALEELDPLDEEPEEELDPLDEEPEDPVSPELELEDPVEGQPLHKP
jgi:hypothetical protein